MRYNRPTPRRGLLPLISLANSDKGSTHEYNIMSRPVLYIRDNKNLESHN